MEEKELIKTLKNLRKKWRKSATTEDRWKHFYIREGGGIFMWNGADWDKVEEGKLHWMLLRCTVEEIEKERAREKKTSEFR